ncbi:MAG: flagellar basal body protein, partial [Alphaproteobacteria bacterium]|nr:flagellar basal body protein [Alphaproteobacteria bacterium]
MSLSGALTAALSGLHASTAAAQIISSNISNSQTDGYTKKSVQLSAVVTGTNGGGVEITGYSRTTDTVLSATLNAATTTSSYYSTQNSYMSQVQAILDSTSNPPALSDDLSAFQAAWTEFAASPSDETIEKTVISAGQKLANTINNIAEQTATLKSSVEDGFLTSIAELNA